MRSWLVYRVDGQYVGECKGVAPEVAFCDCMVGSGKVIDACDIRAVPQAGEDFYQISFEGIDYILKPVRTD